MTPPRRWFRFSLRTMFAAVTAVAILVLQGAPIYLEVTAYSDQHLRAYEIAEYKLNERFFLVLGAEALALVAYLAWWRRRRPTR